MRVRKKVLVLHTLFSLGLAAVLLIPLRPAITEVVERAELTEARTIMRLVMSEAQQSPTEELESLAARWSRIAPEATVRSGTAEELGLGATLATQARLAAGQALPGYLPGDEVAAVALLRGPDGQERFWSVSVRLAEARRAVWELYGLTAAALLAVYALVAAALELFVLPQHVYGPVERMLEADRAVEEGDAGREIIPESSIPADELGELMRSRNRAILALRSHEKALAEALGQVERTANDLKMKNHLLEAAQRNLADADRLASLGMMSAGIAHELNTPLAVVKGLAERIQRDPEHRLDGSSAALLLRVVSRLERLGESLLDFARVRPPRAAEVDVRAMVEESFTLVRLDRDVAGVELVNLVPESLRVVGDGDRLMQVLVNLVRNSAEAIGERRSGSAGEPAEGVRGRGRGRGELSGSLDGGGGGWGAAGAVGGVTWRGSIRVEASCLEREGREWVSLTVTDDGPGIDPAVLSRLFEPFASTRLDAHGTGLGLAVSEGIVREHGGVLLARNRPDGRGAQFEIVLPARGLYPATTVEAEPTGVSGVSVELDGSVRDGSGTRVERDDGPAAAVDSGAGRRRGLSGVHPDDAGG